MIVYDEFIMTNKRLTYSLFLVLVSIWWAWTVLVDVFIIRTVFQTIDNFFLAGDLGLALFSKLNNLEVVVSTLLIAILFFQTKKNKNSIFLLILSVMTWLIAMTYFSYLTPKLAYLTELWKKSDLAGLTSMYGIADVQQEHQFYHKIYIGLDSIKLILLTILLTLGIVKQDKWS